MCFLEKLVMSNAALCNSPPWLRIYLILAPSDAAAASPRKSMKDAAAIWN
jgi:hypothetical protein